MAQTKLIRAAEFVRSGAGNRLSEGLAVEVIADGFTKIRVDGAEGWIETRALGFSINSTAVVAPTALANAGGLASTSTLRLVPFIGKNIVGKDVIVDQAFANLLEFVDQTAGERGLRVHVTSALRRKDAAVSGAIVPPAQRSNHFIGHAIDMNVEFQGTLFNSSRLARQNHASLPAPIVDFLKQIRSHSPLRWGGDFVKADPVHIDDDLSRRDPGLWARKFAELPAG
jgi:hypothetical protein